MNQSWRQSFQQGFLDAWRGTLDGDRILSVYPLDAGYKDGVATFRREGHAQKAVKKKAVDSS